MNDDLGALGRLAALPADPDFGFGRRLMELRNEMVESLGSRRTRELWKELSPVKKGRIAGERTYADIGPLVSVFDLARADPDCREWSVTKIRDALGKNVHARWPLKYGATPAGISKRIGRALLSRAKELEKAKKRDALLRRNLLADLLMDTKSPALMSGTEIDGLKSPLQSID